VIVYLSTERFSSTIRYFKDFVRGRIRASIVPLSYEELFFEGAGPIGHYIFTDFDRLSPYELQSAAAFAGALRAAAPDARILNHPLKSLERYPLLVALNKAGINDFTATRLETGDRPPRYPVFIRCEDGYGGPETDLIHDDEAYDAAVASLAARGLPRRGRIAIGFANQRSADGRFRKYGAFHIAGRIVPHDLMFSEKWVVKVHPLGTDRAMKRMEGYGETAEGVAEEWDYIRANPHEEILRRAFSIAGIDYGRADYGVVDGRVQIYEINTNPHLPWADIPTNRSQRRDLVLKGLIDAFDRIDLPMAQRGRVRFKGPRPRAHNLHLPRRRLAASIARRVKDYFSG
jgi:hypothetical protein